MSRSERDSRSGSTPGGASGSESRSRRAGPGARHLTLAEVLDLAGLACLEQSVELRAPGLLESAVHRPRARMFGTPAYEDPYEQAAALLHGIAANHPLVDGNKRTAWLAAATFLAVNGIDLADVDQDTAYDLVIDVAAGHESDVARVAERLRRM